MGVTLIKKNGSINLTAPSVSGSGESVEEVFIGTEQPLDYNIKLWIDTDAENSYYTKTEVDEKLKNVSVDLTGYATETYVQEKIDAIDIPETDLTNYYTKGQVDAAIDSAIDNIPDIDLSAYALKTEIPSTKGLATETYVNTLVGNIDTLLDDINGEVI